MQNLRKFGLCGLFMLICARVTAAPLTPAELLTKFTTSPNLPKVHYSWGYPDSVLVTPPPALPTAISARLGSVGVHLDFNTVDQIKAGVAMVNAATTIRGSPVALAVTARPWHNEYEGLPWTYGGTPQNPKSNPNGDTYSELMGLFGRLDKLRAGLTTNNPPLMFLLDSEIFWRLPSTDPNAAAWDTAMASKYQLYESVILWAFPNAKITWYAWGITQAASTTGYAATPWVTPAFNPTHYSCPLYRPFEPDGMRDTFDSTLAMARAAGRSTVVPWIGFNWAQARTGTGFVVTNTAPYAYDTVYNRMLGAELNNPWFGRPPQHVRFAEYQAAPHVCIYPSVFDPRTTDAIQYLVSYLEGALE